MIDDGEPYVVVEGRSSDLGPFLLGAALGAGLALLLAPRSGAETREALREHVQSARDRAQVAAEGVKERVSGGLADAREELERRIRIGTRRRLGEDAAARGCGRGWTRRRARCTNGDARAAGRHQS